MEPATQPYSRGRSRAPYIGSRIGVWMNQKFNTKGQGNKGSKDGWEGIPDFSLTLCVEFLIHPYTQLICALEETSRSYRYDFEKRLFASPAESMFLVIAVYVPSLSVSVAMRRASASAAWNGPHPRLTRLTPARRGQTGESRVRRSEEHTSELQSLRHLVCRLLLE